MVTPWHLIISCYNDTRYKKLHIHAPQKGLAMKKRELALALLATIAHTTILFASELPDDLRQAENSCSTNIYSAALKSIQNKDTLSDSLSIIIGKCHASGNLHDLVKANIEQGGDPLAYTPRYDIGHIENTRLGTLVHKEMSPHADQTVLNDINETIGLFIEEGCDKDKALQTAAQNFNIPATRFLLDRGARFQIDSHEVVLRNPWLISRIPLPAPLNRSMTVIVPVNRSVTLAEKQYETVKSLLKYDVKSLAELYLYSYPKFIFSKPVGWFSENKKEELGYESKRLSSLRQSYTSSLHRDINLVRRGWAYTRFLNKIARTPAQHSTAQDE